MSETAGSPDPSVTMRMLIPPMRAVLLLGAILVTLAGIQLFILTTETDHWFAWTIANPLTATFLGAFYFTGLVLAALSARERWWARARVGVPGVLVFLVLTLVATLLHIHKFHLHDPDLVARGAAWLWLAIYAADPILLAVALSLQLRAPGADPPRTDPLPVWYRGLVAADAIVALGTGVALFAAPVWTSSWWPWDLTPLTARAMAAWLLGLGVVLATALRENDWGRIHVATASYTALGVLELVAVARYGDQVAWSRPGAWGYLGAVLSVLAVGSYGWIRSTRIRPTTA